MRRRDFLAAGPLAAVVASACGRARSGDPDRAAGDRPAGRSGAPREADPTRESAVGFGLGVQIYTLREEIAEGLDPVLATLAEIGYREVELYQLHGLTAVEMRSRLDAVGLRAASSHYGLPLLRDDFERTLDGALALGQDLMVVPSLDGDERTAEGLRRVADDFNRLGERIRGAGLRFGYHNHDWEFEALPDGTLPIDLLLDHTDPDLVDWQMDIFWTVQGGGDPMALLGERAGRVMSVHVKDRTATGEMVDVGDGVIDFRTILAEADRQGLMHAFVEHDFPGDAVASVRRSFAHLNSLGVTG
jgi:sugar phosphate isomerase/epimerase